MTKQTTYILAGLAVVVVLVLLMRNSAAAKSTSVTTISGGGGWLAGAGQLIAGVAKGASSIWGTSSGEGYSPNIAYGTDSSIGEVN